MPMRFRSRQQKCRIGSISASRKIRSAAISDESRAGTRAVGDVDRVDAPLLQRAALVDRGPQIVSARREQLHGGDPLAVGQPRPQPRFLGQRRRASGATPAAAAMTICWTFTRDSGLTTKRLRGYGPAWSRSSLPRPRPPAPRSAWHTRPGTRANRNRCGGARLPWGCRHWAGPPMAASSAARPARPQSSSPSGPDAAVHAPGDRLRGAGRQRGQHPLDRLARAVSLFATMAKESTKGALRQPAQAAAQRPRPPGWAGSRK